jgi:catalase
MATLAEQAIEAVHEVYGRHDGYRAVHSKGIVCKGSFRATPDAAGLTRAAHMQGDELPVVARFSNGGGNPGHADFMPDGRGFAVKFYLPDGSRTDVVTLSAPCFFVRTPEDFVRFTRAGKPMRLTGQPGPKMLAWLATHRESWAATRAFLMSKPPASYATTRFNSIHAFKWVDADGNARFVRYSWLPQAGERSLGMREAKGRGADYLSQELEGRLAGDGVRFDLVVQLAKPGDPTDDPTAAWPPDRDTIKVGELALTALETGRDRDGDVLVFDPTRVTDGIELSDDPILRFRSHAYSVSVNERSGVARGAEAEPGAVVEPA